MGHESQGRDTRRRREVSEATSGWARLDTDTIFREMIARELRAGRLTHARKPHIERFGADLGLSTEEANSAIIECREEALHSADSAERRFARRLLDPRPARISTKWKMAVAIAVAIALDVALFVWLF
jgi:hypothetical protein